MRHDCLLIKGGPSAFWAFLGARLDVTFPFVRLSLLCTAAKRFNISTYDLHLMTCRCVVIVVVPSVTLWCLRLYSVVGAGRFNTEK